ncbi:MAG: hypothetical protein AAFP02_05250, partial [Bacteroidota bacterium]
MKQFLLSMVLCFGILSAQAQYYYNPSVFSPTDPIPGNPGGLNTTNEFPLGGGLDPSWVSIQGPSATTVWSPTQTLPFAFNFNGNPVTQYKVSTSGVLTFDVAAATVPTNVNASLPSADIPDNSVCVWGLDGPGANDNIVVQTFGTAPNRQHWVFFASYNYEGGAANCWHYWSIVLEESSDRIYIVDQRTSGGACTPSLTLGVQVDNATATEVIGSPNIAGSAGASAGDDDNIYYEFIFGTRPDYDFDVVGTDLPTAVQGANAPFSFGVTLNNLGAQTINTFDLNYTVDGGTPVVSNISGASLASLSQGSYNVQTPWNPTVNGIYELKMWTENLNGNPDANPLNDTITQTVVVSGASPYYYNPSQVEATDDPAGNPGGLNTIDEFPAGGGLDPSWATIQGPS